MFIEKRFSDESFVEIINTIKSHSYAFMRFDEIKRRTRSKSYTSEKMVLLRHDVDMSPYGALKLGKIEKELEIKSNFFFQLNAGTYQMLSSYCLDICEELRSMGHLVGLHVDSTLFPEEEDKIRQTIDWIRDNLFPMDYAISFHKPHSESLGKKFDSFVSAYDSDFFNLDCYASDSKGEDKFYEKVESYLSRESTFFQLLLHPSWWENETDRYKIYELASIRKQKELDDYMFANFPKVFGHVIKKR